MNYPDASVNSVQRRFRQLAALEHLPGTQPLSSLEMLLAGVTLAGSRVLDVGGGSGIVSYYAATHGAREVVCLEPSSAGSNPRMHLQFERFAEELADAAPVSLIRETLQSFEPERTFDVVVINATINHLDERACARVTHDDHARQVYRELFEKLAAMTATGGSLVIADAARRNAWGAVGLRSPFAPTINWQIHAQPSVWAALARDAGFRAPIVRWRAPRRLGRRGQMWLGNPIGAWLTNSLFILTMSR